MQFSLEVSGVKELENDLKKFNKDVYKGIQREVVRTATNIHREAQDNAPFGAEGTLKLLINWAAAGLSGEVSSGAKYSLDVEKGQKPGKWANWYDLERWVKRKLGITGKKGKSVTYLVRKKIYEKGTEAQPFFEPAVKKYEKRFYDNVTKMIQRL